MDNELETVVVVIDCSLCAVTFDHEIVRCLFLESANFYVMELGRNAGNIGVSVAGIVCKFSRGGVRYGIPVDFGFVFAVRGVPHDFGTVGRNVTDGDVCDFCIFDGAESREKVRGLSAIDSELGRFVFRLVNIGASNVEIIGCTRSEVSEDDIVLYSKSAICCGHVVQKTSS